MNLKIKKKKYTVNSAKIPKEFNGFKILQISDLHSYDTKEEIFNLIDENNKPDIICITGDLIDGKKKDYSCIGLLKRLSMIAPVYYITGNHESVYLDQYEEVVKHIKSCVNILHNEKVIIEKDDKKIVLIGLDDLKYEQVLYGRDMLLSDDRLSSLNLSNNDYNILLLHSPNNFNYIVDNYKPDLILSGHTHGGQIRLPFVGALYAPGQGLFPKLQQGVYKRKNSTLIISSGIGYSRMNIRILCSPEIVEITLKTA